MPISDANLAQGFDLSAAGRHCFRAQVSFRVRFRQRWPFRKEWELSMCKKFCSEAISVAVLLSVLGPAAAAKHKKRVAALQLRLRNGADDRGSGVWNQR